MNKGSFGWVVSQDGEEILINKSEVEVANIKNDSGYGGIEAILRLKNGSVYRLPLPFCSTKAEAQGALWQWLELPR